MRFTIVFHLAVVAFFSSCAHQGVMIAKRFRPLPASEPFGVSGIYTLELRDSAGQIHSQMVTPDVFARYEVGDYFSELQLPPTTKKEEIEQPASSAEIEGPFRPQVYLPVKTTRVDHENKEGGRIAGDGRAVGGERQKSPNESNASASEVGAEPKSSARSRVKLTLG